MELSFTCPACSQLIAHDEPSGRVSCDACGWSTSPVGHLCPNCGTLYREETPVCGQCGEATARLCSSCGGTNWSGNEVCDQCGTSLDILEFVPQYTSQGYRDRLRKQMLESGHLKELEEVASRRRMEALLQIEAERQMELARRRVKQRGAERQTVLIFLAVAVFILVAAFLLILLT